MELLSSLLDNHAPAKTVLTTIRSFNPQFMPNLFHECHKKQKLERAWHRSHSDNACLFYGNQFRLYNSLLNKALSNYLFSLFVNCSDSKYLWYSIDKVLYRSSTSNTAPSASLSVHQFSSFFTDKIISLCANLSLIDVNPISFPDQPAPVFSLFELVTT